jgi:hypothetical protein
MNIWILENNSGRTLLFKSFLEFKSDEILISGLLTAFNQFTMSEFNDPIESIDMGGLRWIYIQDIESNLLFVASDTKDIIAEVIRSRLDAIKQSFLEEYTINKEVFSEKWNGDLDVFQSFINVIENYYSQWTQAENIDSFAGIFDILGVFQQILNIIRRIINNQIQDDKKEKIYKNIEKLFEEFSYQQEIADHPELNKISFSREYGFNLISINPMKCNVVFLKNQIMNLLENVIKIFKEDLGYELSLNYYGKENLFKYILNNIILLKRLNLDVFLFDLLLIN